MLKREKEVYQYLLDNEEAVIKALEKHYRDALSDINMSIRIMQSDELTQSKVYQLEYQKALKKQVEGILERMHAKEYTTIQQYLSDSYKDAFIGSMYAMHGQGIPIIAAIDQNAAVKAVITDSKISEGLYEHLGIPVQYMKKAISDELARGISSNMRYADIARNIESTTNAPLTNAKNIVRTEGHRIQQASSHDARLVSKSKGADVVKQWDATLDGATRTIHRQLDGKIVEVDEPFTHGSAKAMYPGDFGEAGLDCQCRCVALTRARWALDETELATLKERAAFFKLDKTEDFQDFKKKYLKAAETLENTGKSGIIKEGENYISGKGFSIHEGKVASFMLKPGAKHYMDFHDAGYRPGDDEKLVQDIEKGYDASKATNHTVGKDGSMKFSIFMELGRGKTKRFRTVWQIDDPETAPRFITAHREG